MMKPAVLGIPKGPRLLSMQRSRPVDYPDREQREKMEYEEMLK